jgi:hypothetical protein
METQLHAMIATAPLKNQTGMHRQHRKRANQWWHQFVRQRGITQQTNSSCIFTIKLVLQVIHDVVGATALFCMACGLMHVIHWQTCHD